MKPKVSSAPAHRAVVHFDHEVAVLDAHAPKLIHHSEPLRVADRLDGSGARIQWLPVRDRSHDHDVAALPNDPFAAAQERVLGIPQERRTTHRDRYVEGIVLYMRVNFGARSMSTLQREMVATVVNDKIGGAP